MVTDVDLTVVEGNDQVDRILDAAQALVARWGVAKTSVRDIAVESGISRATVYRVFPGGKQQVFVTLAHREVATYAEAVADAIDSGHDLADAVTRGIVVAARLLRDHDAAQFVLLHEPGLFTPVLGFRGVDVLFREAATRLGPRLERFVPADRAAWAVEWATRLFVSYVANPNHDADLSDVEVTSRLVEHFLAPAFAGDRSESATEPATAPVATIH
jgi:AcrR family transcriptional regulator